MHTCAYEPSARAYNVRVQVRICIMCTCTICILHCGVTRCHFRLLTSALCFVSEMADNFSASGSKNRLFQDAGFQD